MHCFMYKTGIRPELYFPCKIRYTEGHVRRSIQKLLPAWAVTIRR